MGVYLFLGIILLIHFLEFVFSLCGGVGVGRSINFLVLGNALRDDALERCAISTPVLEGRPLCDAIIRRGVASSIYRHYRLHLARSQ